MPLLCEVYAIIGQGDVPPPGVSKADAHLCRQSLTQLGKGMGIVNELLARHPRAPLYRRRGDHQDLASIQGDAREEPLQPLSGLLRTSTLEQIVSSEHDDQQISISREGGGRRWNLPAILTHVADTPAGFLDQNVHPSAVRIIAAAEIVEISDSFSFFNFTSSMA